MNISLGKITEKFDKNPSITKEISTLYANGSLTITNVTTSGKTQSIFDGQLEITGKDVNFNKQVIYPYIKSPVVDHL